MPITGRGWELHIERLGVQSTGSKQRTYGRYQVHLEGVAVEGLAGFICERVGPGDNQTAGNGKRIEAGSYPLWTQFGKYRTIGYSEDLKKTGAPPMPGLLLQGTGKRVGILIHPAHPPSLYLSSIGCLNPSGPVRSDQSLNFWDSRARVIALIDDLRRHAPEAFAHQVSTWIPKAQVVIDGEPIKKVPDSQAAPPPATVAMLAAAKALPASLPISKSAAIACATWLKANYGPALTKAVRGKPYAAKHLCGIVCQETAYKWLKWKDTMDAKTIVERCVFDASGDFPGTARTAFPVNTAAFRERYGGAFTDMLIEEANKTRRLQAYGDKPWVYKGYGIFQYDLQKVDQDRAFFESKLWYDFDECLKRVCKELDEKLVASGGDLWDAIRRYNGSGARARQYMENVKVFTDYCATVVGGG